MLPTVVDRDAEFDTVGFRMQRIARLANHTFEAVDLHGCDDAELVALADMDEMIEHVARQFTHRAEETVVARTCRKRPEVVLQLLRIAGFDETQSHQLPLAGAQHIRILLEIIDTQRGHCQYSRVVPKKSAGAPPTRRRRLGCSMPARTVFQFREPHRPNSRRRHASRARSSGTTPGAHAGAPAIHGASR